MHDQSCKFALHLTSFIDRSSHSTYSSICPTWRGCSERERSTLGSGWLGYSPRSRKEWHHHILYCPAARHTWCCCPEWDSCSGEPNICLSWVTCSQPDQFEAIHNLLMESCRHNHCWSWAIYINWCLSSVPYLAVEWVVGCHVDCSLSLMLQLHWYCRRA